MLEDEITELKNQLDKKRESITQLCQAQTRHINLIEKLEGQVTGKIANEGYYEHKYKELEHYMEEYITSAS